MMKNENKKNSSFSESDLALLNAARNPMLDSLLISARTLDITFNRFMDDFFNYHQFLQNRIKLIEKKLSSLGENNNDKSS